MKVTITIEDDGDGGIEWGGAARGRTSGARTSAGPHIRGPHIVIPHEDGTETEIDIEGLAAAAEQDKPRRPSRRRAPRCATSAAWVRLATRELAEDVGDVQARGLGADEQALGDLPVRQPLADQLEHLGLARGEAERGQRRPVGASPSAAVRRAERHAGAARERLELRAHQLGAERARLLVRGAQRVARPRGRPRPRSAASARRQPA